MNTFTVIGEAWGDGWFILKDETCNNTTAMLKAFPGHCVQLVGLKVPCGTRVKFAFKWIKDGVTQLVDYKEL